MSTVYVNGDRRTSGGESLGELLRELGYDLDSRGIAAAVNGEIVPRSRWGDQPLVDGDRVELVGAVQGG